VSSVAETSNVRVTFIAADETSLTVTLSDGRRLTLPLEWFPRLKHGSPAERNHWRLIGRGEGVHWPDLDEDLSVDGFLAGRKSGESAASLKAWLSQRAKSRKRKTA